MAKTKNSRGQGEGSIREKFKTDKITGKKVSIGFEGRYTAGVAADGKQNQKSVFGKTRLEASQKLTKVLNEINQGTYTEATKVTIAEWFKTWLWEYKKDSVKLSSFTRYESLYRVHILPAIGPTCLKDLRPEHIQKIINEKVKEGLSTRSIKYIHITLHNALEQALKNGLVIRNVSEAVSLPRQIKKEIRVFTKDEQKKFIKAIQGNRLEAAFILDLATGLRLGELMALKWTDINLKDGVLKVSRTIQRTKTHNKDITAKKTEVVINDSPKTKAGFRSIPLLAEVVAALKKHKTRQAEEKLKAGGLIEDGGLYEDSNVIFCNELGGYIEPRRMIEFFEMVITDAGIEKTNFHAVRHTFATRALENGIPAKVVSEILGHSTIAMTLDLYSHVLPEMKQKEMKKLKGLFI